MYNIVKKKFGISKNANNFFLLINTCIQQGIKLIKSGSKDIHRFIFQINTVLMNFPLIKVS